MNTLERLDQWSASHNSKLLDVLRMALGIFLIIKGIQFAGDRESLNQILTESQFAFMSLGLVHYIVFVHLVGGILITLGLVTRIAVIFNLPVLLGAVIFINAEKGIFSVNTELWSSLITLILLITYLLYGSGKLSADEYLRTHNNV